MACARLAYDGDGHLSDRASACNQYVLAKDGEGPGGVKGVAERVEYRGHVEIDGLTVSPDVHLGDRDGAREATIPSHADPRRVATEMTPSGQAVSAMPTDDVAFAANDLAR